MGDTPKYGDTHPVTGRIYLGKQKSCVNGERWATPEEFKKRVAYWRQYSKSPAHRERQKVLRNTDTRRAERNAYSKVYTKLPDVKAKAAAAARLRRRTDPLFCMAGRVRARLREAFRQNGDIKKTTTFEILGCTWTEFKEYMEKLFLPGMSWDNRDKWEIDHKIPLSVAKTEQEILKLSHHTNLQPLWTPDNRKKSYKVLFSPN